MPSSTRSLWVLSNNVIDPAPTINVHVSALNGSATVTALPDSGADISVAGPDTITMLGDHCNNLLPSDMTPRGVTAWSLDDTDRPNTRDNHTRYSNLQRHPTHLPSSKRRSTFVEDSQGTKSPPPPPPDYPSPLSSPDTPSVSAVTTKEGTNPTLDPAKEFPNRI